MTIVHRYETKNTRKAVAAICTRDAVCAAVAGVAGKHTTLFGENNEANVIAQWCIEHYREFGGAPDKAIQTIFEDWYESGADEGLAELVEKLLTTASEDETLPKDDNYLIKFVEDHLNKIRLQRNQKAIGDELERNRVSEAETLRASYEPIQLTSRGPELVSSSSIDRRAVEWLWRGWIPAGELTVIDGDPGTGKSQLCIDLAARLSRGWQMPPARARHYRGGMGRRLARDAGNSIYLTSEDDGGTTIGPRLDAANANSDRVVHLSEDADLPELPKDLEKVERWIVEQDAKLLVFDPLFGFLSGKVNSNSDQKIRTVTSHLAKIAQRTRCAIVLIRHLNKKADEPALYRGGGSIGLIAQCRSALICGRSPEDRETRVIAPNKLNIAMPPQALAYGIEPRTIGDGIATSRIAWQGEVDLDASDIVRQPKQKQGRPNQREAMVDRMKALLVDGPMPAKELERQIRSEFDVSEPTYKRARKDAGVTAKRDGFGGSGEWKCHLNGKE